MYTDLEFSKYLNKPLDSWLCHTPLVFFLILPMSRQSICSMCFFITTVFLFLDYHLSQKCNGNWWKDCWVLIGMKLESLQDKFHIHKHRSWHNHERSMDIPVMQIVSSLWCLLECHPETLLYLFCWESKGLCTHRSLGKPGMLNIQDCLFNGKDKKICLSI